MYAASRRAPAVLLCRQPGRSALRLAPCGDEARRAGRFLTTLGLAPVASAAALRIRTTTMHPRHAGSRVSGLTRAHFCSTAAGAAESETREELTLFASTQDFGQIVSSSYYQVQLGAALGAGGFAMVALAAASSAGPQALAVLGAGLILNTYVSMVMPKKAMLTLATRHVERCTLRLPVDTSEAVDTLRSQDGAVAEAELPADASAAGGRKSKAPAADGNPAAPDTVGSGRFEAMGSVELVIITPNLRRTVWLEDAVKPWEGARFSGLVEDNRVSFGDLCYEQNLSFDMEKGRAFDMEMLEELLATDKVVADETVEFREDTDELIRLPAKFPKEMLGGVQLMGKKGDRNESSSSKGPQSPAGVIHGIGQRAFYGGAFLFIVGFSFGSRSLWRGQQKQAAAAH